MDSNLRNIYKYKESCLLTAESLPTDNQRGCDYRQQAVVTLFLRGSEGTCGESGNCRLCPEAVGQTHTICPLETKQASDRDTQKTQIVTCVSLGCEILHDCTLSTRWQFGLRTWKLGSVSLWRSLMGNGSRESKESYFQSKKRCGFQ